MICVYLRVINFEQLEKEVEKREGYFLGEYSK